MSKLAKTSATPSASHGTHEAVSGFAYRGEQFQQLIEDVLAEAKQLGAPMSQAQIDARAALFGVPTLLLEAK